MPSNELRYWQALIDITGYEGWQSNEPASKAMGDIARAALEEAPDAQPSSPGPTHTEQESE